MAQDLTQFNFKLPTPLLKQLKNFAETQNSTTTELIIRGIHHVLGLATEHQKIGSIDSDIYKKLDAIEQRFQDFEDYQSGVDLEFNKRITILEHEIERTRIRATTSRMLNGIANNVYSYISSPRLQEGVVTVIDSDVNHGTWVSPSLATTSHKSTKTTTDIDSDVVPRLDQIKEYLNNKTTTVRDIATELDQTREHQNKSATENRFVLVFDGIDKEDVETQTLSRPERKQLAILELDTNEHELLKKAQKVNSSELVEHLRLIDPDKNWNNDKLTIIRRSKKQQAIWQTVGNCKFKFAGENEQGSKYYKYSWWLVRPEEEKSKT